MENKKYKTVMRLARFLAQAGIASRRRAEDIIKAGRVKVNGQVVKNLASQVSSQDKIELDNKLLAQDKKVYYLLNKPKGYVSSARDPHNSKNVLSLVPKNPRVFPVGRLDKDSQGLLLMTNDGDFAYQLTHPKFLCQKTYLVKVNKEMDSNIKSKLEKGMKFSEGLARADKVKILAKNELEIVLHQGFNRQIRRMMAELGYKVIFLKRIKQGNFSLGNLPEGKYRPLKLEEIKK